MSVKAAWLHQKYTTHTLLSIIYNFLAFQKLLEIAFSAVEILVYLEKIYIEMNYISFEREFYELFNGVSCHFVSGEQKKLCPPKVFLP